MESATTQFLGMIANHVLCPRMLLADWSPAPRRRRPRRRRGGHDDARPPRPQRRRPAAALRAPAPLRARTAPRPGAPERCGNLPGPRVQPLEDPFVRSSARSCVAAPNVTASGWVCDRLRRTRDPMLEEPQ
ncbi:hypothetical protein ABZ638_26855 [Streptomyces sp. NPDC007107]|uniref:hypothetical protein n=1 Tax=Streptomyces sp. NPDC007107 TaxID=3156915 RepID=UPI003409427F